MKSASRPPIRPPPVELEPPHVPQPLQLLPDFRPHIVVARIDRRQPPLEPIDLGQGELRPSDVLDAFHHVEQPAPRGRGGVAQEQGRAPLVQHGLFGDVRSGADQGDATGQRHLTDQDVAPLPARAAGGHRQGLARLDDGLGEEVAGHDDQVGDAGAGLVIAHDHQAGTVRRRQPRLHRAPGPVDQSGVGTALGGLEFVFLGTDAAMEIGHGRVGREGGQGRRAAAGAEGVGGDPPLAQDAGVPGRPLEDRRLFGEAERSPSEPINQVDQPKVG